MLTSKLATLQRQCDGRIDRHARPNIEALGRIVEAARGDRELICVRRNVAELEVAGGIAGRFALVTGDSILKDYSGADDDGAVRISDNSGDGAGAAKRLGMCGDSQNRQ